MDIRALVPQRSVEVLNEAGNRRFARSTEVRLNLKVIGPHIHDPPSDLNTDIDEDAFGRNPLHHQAVEHEQPHPRPFSCVLVPLPRLHG
jgi:hypothetical protein